jgi:hypothetical protein
MRRAAVPLSWLALSLAVLALVVVSTPAVGQAPKSGGVLNVMQRGDLAQGWVKGRPPSPRPSTAAPTPGPCTRAGR